MILGRPEHGWLPVNFRYKDFALDFYASDALNDPIEELYDVITQLQDNECREIVWYLEPSAFLFDTEKRGRRISLTIKETDDLHNKNADVKLLTMIAGNSEEIIEPFRIAIKQFVSQTYEEMHWPYNLSRDKIDRL